jgi:Asp-tRNA(Asn)/Glu-tRNA(Gln) amidotransferase A subunit family amidase
MRDELAAALRRSSGTMHDDLVTARLLAGLLPQTAASLADGRITARHARAIADHARRLDGYQVAVFQHPSVDSTADSALRSRFTAMCAQLEASALPIAERTTPQRTDAAARRAVAVIDADSAERRRQRARAAVNVRIIPEDDGLALLLARLPLEHAARVHAAIDARARLTPADCAATLGELRAQALVDAVCGSALPDAPAVPAAVQVEVQVVIDAAALTGLVNLPAVLASGPAAGSPMTAQAVRDLLADPDVPTSLRRLVTDPITGHLLDRGRHSYQVTDAMRAFLAVRDAADSPLMLVPRGRSWDRSARCVNGEHRRDRLPGPAPRSRRTTS